METIKTTTITQALPDWTIHLLALLLLAGSSLAAAQDKDIHLKCKGTQESVGTLFAHNTKPIEFDLKANPTSGAIAGGFSELIASTETFARKVDDSEFSGHGSGRSSVVSRVILAPSFYTLNRHTGRYYVNFMSLHEDKDKSSAEYTIRALCEPVAKKF